MVHEYIRHPALLAEALRQAHLSVSMLCDFVAACQANADARRLA